MVDEVARKAEASRLRFLPVEIGHEQEFRRARDLLLASDPAFGFAHGFDPERPFGEFVAAYARGSRGEALEGDAVPFTYLCAWIGDPEAGGRIVGRVSIRHRLNDWLARVGGHVGYATLAEFRGRGFAEAMLREGLARLSALGIARALITCDDGNAPSSRVIERSGGVLEGIVPLDPGAASPVMKRRYWIEIPTPLQNRK